jgi:hypothetical protein
VSVQPMSLPSGLIFFLDFVFSAEPGQRGEQSAGVFGSSAGRVGELQDQSLYGGGVVGSQVTGGVNLAGALGDSSFRDITQGYSSPTGSVPGATPTTSVILRAGTYGDEESLNMGTAGLGRVFRGDPELVSGTTQYVIVKRSIHDLYSQGFQSGAAAPLHDIVMSGSDGAGGFQATRGAGTALGSRATAGFQVRRLTDWSGSANDHILMVVASLDGAITGAHLDDQIDGNSFRSASLSFPIADRFVAAGSPFGAIAGSTV